MILEDEHWRRSNLEAIWAPKIEFFGQKVCKKVAKINFHSNTLKNIFLFRGEQLYFHDGKTQNVASKNLDFIELLPPSKGKTGMTRRPPSERFWGHKYRRSHGKPGKNINFKDSYLFFMQEINSNWDFACSQVSSIVFYFTNHWE